MRRKSGIRWTALWGALAAMSALAAPAAMAADSAAQRAWLGVYSQELNQGLREGIEYSGTGVLVNRVVPESPADRAGLRKGDVIVSLNSRNVGTPSELARMVGGMSVGKMVSLGIVRDGARRTLSASLAARQEEDDVEAPPADREPDESGELEPDSPLAHIFQFKGGPEGLEMLGMGRGRLGIRIGSLNPDLGGYFGLPDGRGALVLEVLKETPAERAGLKAGDVITRVGDRTVNDTEDLTGALRKMEGSVALTIMRKGARRTISAQLEPAPRAMRWKRGDDWTGLNDQDKVVIRRNGEGPGDTALRDQVRQLREELRSLREEIHKQQHD